MNKTLIGKKCLYPALGADKKTVIKIQVKVLQTKNVVGQEYYLVEPVAGEGRLWVRTRNLSRVNVN